MKMWFCSVCIVLKVVLGLDIELWWCVFDIFSFAVVLMMTGIWRESGWFEALGSELLCQV
jgi:hypothetical protein